MSNDADRPTTRSAPPPATTEDFGEDRETVVALFGDSTRSGTWLPPEHLNAVAGFGNVKLDFTLADLPPGPTEVQGFAVFGNVEILVPPHIDVEQSGISIFGKVTHRSSRKAGKKLLRRVLGTPETAAPPEDGEERWLVVRGWAVFGNLRVTVVEA